MTAEKESTSSDQRPELWGNDTCTVCQTECPSEEQKLAHSKQSSHIRRTNIHDFLRTVSSTRATVTDSSAIARRYEQCNEHAIGVECIYEFSFSWCKSGWWACSICYESGSNLDLLDAHLNSKRHLSIYIEELHPQMKVCDDVNGLLTIKEKIFLDEQNGRILPPEIYPLQLAKADAWVALVTTEKEPPYKVHKSKIDGIALMVCEVCHEVIPCDPDNSKNTRTWAVHSLTPTHRAALTINQVIELCQPQEVLDESPADGGPYEWKEDEWGQLNGPVCGISHLVVFGRQSFCSLCFCIVDSLEEHFSSESHILKFVNKINPTEAYSLTYCSLEKRRNTLLTLLTKDVLSNDRSRECCVVNLPIVVRSLAHDNTLPLPHMTPDAQPFDLEKQCFFCPTCWKVVPLPDADSLTQSWEEHINTKEHMVYGSKRNEYMFDNSCFVSVSSTIKLHAKKVKGTWTDRGVLGMCHDQADVGLEYVVEDQERGEVVCTLCAETFPSSHCSLDGVVTAHIRSLDHLLHYLHVTNLELLALILSKNDEKVVLDLTMEWMQRAITTTIDDLRVYNPVLANKMNNWARVPIRTMDASSFDAKHRPVYEVVHEMIDQIADDGVEKQDVSMRDALVMSGIRIVNIQEKNGRMELVCRCTQCEVVFPTEEGRILKDAWNGHFQTDEHFRRLTAFTACKMESYGFSETTSSYTVKGFPQKDPQKKVTWQWNPTDKVHEFVLAVVGLEDIVERKTTESVHHSSPDFFCRLCAVAFPRRAHLLDAHVRSATHVYCYVHKHHPLTVKKIECLEKNDGGKEQRKELAQLLKNVKAPSEYCIPVYDPIGEQEKRGLVAMQKVKEAERLRQLEEQRRVAEEERKRRDAERRKQREKDLEKQKKLQEEREKREKEARERTARLEAEKERVKQVAMQKKKEIEEAQKKVEEEKQRIKEKEKAHLRELLEKEKQRYMDLKEKKKQLELAEEQKRLQKELEELRSRNRLGASSSILPPSSVPQPQLIIPSSSSTVRLPQSGFGTFSSVPSNQMSVPPPSHLPIQSPIIPPPPTVISQPTVWNVCGRPSLQNTRVDPYILDPMIIHTREQLIDFIYRQGPDTIPSDELPKRFNKYVTATEGLLGTDAIWEVVCLDDVKLDTFFCTMCNVWALPNKMFEHMESNGHRLNYLLRNCKAYHRAVMSENNITVRNAMVEQFAIQLWKMESNHPEVKQRMRIVLNKEAIERLWPDYMRDVDHSWMRDKRSGTPLPESPRREVSNGNRGEYNQYDDDDGIPMGDDDDIIVIDPEEEKRKKKREEELKEKEKRRDKEKQKEREKEKPKERERKRSASPRKRRSSRSRSRERKRAREDRDTKKRSVSRDRKRRSSRSRDRDRRRSSRERERSKDRRRRSRSRSRSRTRTSRENPSSKSDGSLLNSAVPGGALSWEQSAAAFLAKIGDMKGASKVLDDRRRKHSEGDRDSPQSRPTSSSFSSFVPQIAATTLPLPEQIRQSVESPSRLSMDDHHSRDSVTIEKPSTTSTVSRSVTVPKKPAEPVDQNSQLRKMLGLIVTMQAEAEKRGGLEENVVNNLYSEMGLTRNDGSEGDALMGQLCSLISGTGEKAQKKIDLSKFGISKEQPKIDMPSLTTSFGMSPSFGGNTPTGYGNTPTSQSMSFGQNQMNMYGVRKETNTFKDDPNYGNYPSSSQHSTASSVPKLPSNLNSLLSGLKGTLDALKKRREPSPPPLPTSNLVMSTNEDVFGGSEEVSYVYPTREDYDEEEEEKRRARYRSIDEGAVEEDLWDQDQYGDFSHQRRSRGVPSKPPVQSRPCMPTHPSDRGGQLKGYSPALPAMARTSMPQPTPPTSAPSQSAARGLPPQKQAFMDAREHNNPNRPINKKKQRGPDGLTNNSRNKMKRKLVSQGFNPDSFTFSPSGPKPIPGAVLAMPSNRQSNEGRTVTNESWRNNYNPADYVYMNVDEEDDDVQCIEDDVQQKQMKRVVGTDNQKKREDIVEVADDDWEGVENDLQAMLAAEKAKLELQKRKGNPSSWPQPVPQGEMGRERERVVEKQTVTVVEKKIEEGIQNASTSRVDPPTPSSLPPPQPLFPSSNQQPMYAHSQPSTQQQYLHQPPLPQQPQPMHPQMSMQPQYPMGQDPYAAYGGMSGYDQYGQQQPSGYGQYAGYNQPPPPNQQGGYEQQGYPGYGQPPNQYYGQGGYY